MIEVMRDCCGRVVGCFFLIFVPIFFLVVDVVRDLGLGYLYVTSCNICRCSTGTTTTTTRAKPMIDDR